MADLFDEFKVSSDSSQNALKQSADLFDELGAPEELDKIQREAEIDEYERQGGGLATSLEKGVRRAYNSLQGFGALIDPTRAAPEGHPAADFYKSTQDEAARRINEQQQEISQLPVRPDVARAIEAGNKEEDLFDSIGAAVSELAKSPDKIGLTADMTAEQIPNFLTFALGTKGADKAARLVPGLTKGGNLTKGGQAASLGGGGYFSSVAATYGSNVAEGLEKGLAYDDAEARALKQSAAQAIIDGATASVLPFKIGPGQYTNIPAQALIQAAGGGTGEIARNTVVGEEVQGGEVAIEGLLELLGLPFEASTAMYQAARNKPDAQPGQQPPPQTPPPEPASPAPERPMSELVAEKLAAKMAGVTTEPGAAPEAPQTGPIPDFPAVDAVQAEPEPGTINYQAEPAPAPTTTLGVNPEGRADIETGPRINAPDFALETDEQAGARMQTQPDPRSTIETISTEEEIIGPYDPNEHYGPESQRNVQYDPAQNKVRYETEKLRRLNEKASQIHEASQDAAEAGNEAEFERLYNEYLRYINDLIPSAKTDQNTAYEEKRQYDKKLKGSEQALPRTEKPDLMPKSGNPYKSEKTALTALKTKRGRGEDITGYEPVPVNGGFVLRHTGKQVQLDKPKPTRLTREQIKQKERSIQPNEDNLLAAIAKLGGLSREEAQAQGIDPAEFNRRGHKIKRVFTNGGLSFDAMAEILNQYGYPVRDADGNYNPNTLLESLSAALAGKQVGTPATAEAQMELEAQAREADQEERAKAQAEFDALIDEVAEEDGYTETTAELAKLQERAETVLGADAVEAIVERVAMQEEGDGFNQAITEALEAAIREQETANKSRVGAGQETESRSETAPERTETQTEPVTDQTPPQSGVSASGQIFTSKSALYDGYGASVGSIMGGDRRQLMIDPNGGYYWGDWRQESKRDVGAVAGGTDKNATPASFPTSKEAREAAESTPREKTSPSKNFTLEQQTAADLKAKEQEEADRAAAEKEAEQKAKADAERDSFTLAGSNAAVDQAEARGQSNLFDQPSAETKTAPSEKARPAQEQIGTEWDALTEAERLDVLQRNGWETKAGNPDRTAKKASKLEWVDLTPAMQNVLRRKGLEKPAKPKPSLSEAVSFGSRALTQGEFSFVLRHLGDEKSMKLRSGDRASILDRGRKAGLISEDGRLIVSALDKEQRKKLGNALKNLPAEQRYYESLYGDLFTALEESNKKPKLTVIVGGKSEASTSYEGRYKDRVNQINSSNSFQEIDAVLEDEYSDNERHMEGTEKVEIAAKSAKSKIESNESVARKKKAEESGEWIYFDEAGSIGTAKVKVSDNNNKSDGYEYKYERSQGPFGEEVAIYRRKIKPQPNNQAAESKQETAKTDQPAEKPVNKEQTLFEQHSATVDAMMDGKLTLEQYKAGFEFVAANREAILAELAKETKQTLLDRMGGMRAYRIKNEKKARVVQGLYTDMLEDFLPPSSDGGMYSFSPKIGGDYLQNITDAVRDKVNSVTEEKLKAYAERIAASEKERAEQKKAIEKGLENPETLDDFSRYLRAKMDGGLSFQEARMTLTPEQREKFDSMAAESTRSERKERKENQRTQVSYNREQVETEIVETTHTRDGYDLFVVKPAERVERDVYKDWLAAAKKMGGWYSKFRGRGAVPGFQFKDREAAEAFQKYVTGGDTKAVQEKAKERRNAFADDRSQSAVERLTEMADRLEDRATEKLNQDRKTNTSRRAAMAASAEAQANYDLSIAKTMRNIASAIESGEAKFLDQMRTKAQVEMLATQVRLAKDEQLRAKYDSYGEQEKHKYDPPDNETADYATWPSYTAYRSDLAKLGRELSAIDGMKLIGQKILKVADDTSKAYDKFAKENLHQVSRFATKSGSMAVFPTKKAAGEAILRSGYQAEAVPLQIKRGEWLIVLSPSEAMKQGIWQGDNDKRITLRRDFVDQLVGKANRRKDVSVPWQFESAYEKLTRLSSMGIETPAEFRSALREFIQFREEAARPDKVKELERKMVGRRKDGLDFFPTPETTADEMVEAADIQEGMSILEPSAGMGHIADRIREAGYEPDVIEMSGDRRELLEAKGYNVVGSDFMDFTGRAEGKDLGENILTLKTQAKEIQNAKDKLADLNKKQLDRLHSSSNTRARTTTHNANAGRWAERLDQLRDGMRKDVRKFLSEGYTVPEEYIELSRAEYNEQGNYDPIEVAAGGKYDRIIMNPPFSDRRDMAHVQHAYDLLKPGGRLVAIMGEGVFFGSDKKATGFREWLDKVGGSEEKLTEGTFKDANLPVNTSVNARMVVIEKGDVEDVQFSRYASEGKKPLKGITPEEAQRAIDDFTAEFANPEGIRFDVRATPEDAFGAGVWARLKREGVHTAKGGYYAKTGRILLIASHLSSYNDAIATLRHEVLAHYGLNIFTPAEKRAVLDKIAQSRNVRSLQKLWAEIDKNYADHSELKKAEELLARVAENKQAKLSKWWNDFVVYVRGLLKKVGLIDDKVTKAELKKLVETLGEAIKQGRPQQTFPGSDASQFSNQSYAPKFYSQMQRVLEKKLPGTSSANQYKKTIQAFANKGEFKAEELEWSGIEQWLDSQLNKKISKQDVLDFLAANEIKVEEVTHSKESSARTIPDIENEIRESEPIPEEIKDRAARIVFDNRDSVTAGDILDREGSVNFDSLDDQFELAAKMSFDDAVSIIANDEFLFQESYPSDTDTTKFAKYTLPGGENYRELLLTLPFNDKNLPEKPAPITELPEGYELIHDSQGSDKSFPWGEWGIIPPGQAHARGHTGRYYATQEEAIQASIDQLNSEQEYQYQKQVDEANTGYKSGHFDEPNILAHIRFNERTDADGKRVLFIEEVQSDWHQEGRKKGYKSDSAKRKAEEADTRRAFLSSKLQDALEKDDYLGFDSANEAMRAIAQDKDFAERWELSPETLRLANEWLAVRAEAESLYRDAQGVPDAPFKTTWPLLAMKRMIRYAAENGFDRIAWTTGEQQAERYDLSKQVKMISLIKDRNRDGNYVVYIEGLDGDAAFRNQNGFSSYGQKTVTPTELEELIGKEAAKNMIEGADRAAQRSEDEWYDSRPSDLKVGGEGMKGFYDQILPKTINKYVKKWGAKVEGAVIPATQEADVMNGIEEESGQFDAHAIDITPSMREAVLEEGQPMFRRTAPDKEGDKVIAVWDAEGKLASFLNREKAPITLNAGVDQGAKGGNRYGLKHAEGGHLDDVLKLGFSDMRSFIDHVLEGPMEVRKGDGASVALVRRSEDGKPNVVMVRLEDMPTGTAYIIDTAGRFTNRRINKMPLVRDGANLQQLKEESLNALDSGRTSGKRNPSLETEDSQVLEDEMPMFSRVAGDPLEMPKGKKFANKFVDSLIYNIVDRFKDLADIQKAIGPVPESHDAFLAQENFSGRARKRLDDLDDFHVRPLLKAVSAADFTLEDVGRYLHARHAQEANAVLKERNPDRENNDALSGMTDQEAQQILSEYTGNDAMQEIVGMVDKMNQERVETLVADGLLTQEEADAWQNTYQKYVPLHRDDFIAEDGEVLPLTSLPRKGQGYHIAGKESKIRAGSTKEVNHALIIPHVIAQYEASAIRGEKNLVNQTLLNLVQDFPDPDLWTINGTTSVPELNAAGEIVRRERIDTDHSIALKIDGKPFYVTFNPRNKRAMRLLKEMKNLAGKEMPRFMRYAHTAMRYLSAVNTSFSPEFVFSNFARDLQTAGYNLGDTDIDGLQRTIIKDAVRHGIKGMWKNLRHQHNSEWAKYADQFERAGGMVGWMEAYETIQDRAKAIESEMKLLGKGQIPRKALRGLGDLIHDANGAIENAVRLSAFVHARRQGMSSAKAANLAKNLTVNFNRRGAQSQYLNTAYLFFNASVQGSARLIAAATKSPKVRKMIGATIVAAAILDIVNRELSGDDEDDRKFYDKIPDHVKDRNLIIMYGQGPEDFVTIPLPWGYNIFHVLGQTIGRGVYHHGVEELPTYSTASDAARLLNATLEAFNPVHSGSLLQTASPTLLDPLVAIGENKAWHGGPVTPEKNPFGPPQPNSQRYFRSVSEPSKFVSEKLNELTGGNRLRPGWWDWSPEWIDEIWNTATGSAGRFLLNTVDTATRVATGEEVEGRNIPFWRKIHGHEYPAMDYELYYERKDDLDILKNEIKTLKGFDKQRVMTATADKRKMIGYLKMTEKRLQAMRKRRRYLEDTGAPRREIDEINDQMREVMKQFNRRYQQIVNE